MRLKILYCGVCHSDLHSIKNETGKVTYPVLPGYVSLSNYIFIIDYEVVAWTDFSVFHQYSFAFFMAPAFI